MPQVHRLGACLNQGPNPDLSAPKALVLSSGQKNLSVLLAQSAVGLLSIQPRRILDGGAKEGWHPALVDGWEEYGKGCWAEVMSPLDRYGTGGMGWGQERVRTSQPHSVARHLSDLMFHLLNVKKNRAQPTAVFSEQNRYL